MPVVKNMRDLLDGEMREALDWSDRFKASEPTDAEKRIGTMLPGTTDDPSTHPFMGDLPRCLNWNPMRVKCAWEAGELTEAEVMAYERYSGERVRPNQADPIPDEGGITRPYTGIGCVEGPGESYEKLNEGPQSRTPARKAPAGQPSARGFAVVKVD